MFTFFDRASGVYHPGKAAVVVMVVAICVMPPAIAVAHDSSGPIQPLTWHEPEAASSPKPETAFAPGGHFARLQVHETPLWQPYRSRKRSRTAIGSAPAKGSTASSSPISTAPISIYEDKTLRRGDAVMTSAGLRIFEGSVTFPYRPTDFSTLDASKRVPRSIRKDLALYDHQIPEAPQVADHAPDMVINVSGLPQRPLRDAER